MKIRVAGAQISVIGDVDCNFDAINEAIDYAIQQKADILLTPEGSLSGYHPKIKQDKVNSALLILLDKAKKAKLGLALGTIFKESDGKEYNQIRFYNKKGEFLGFHSKILKTTGEMHDYTSSPLKTFNFEGLKIAGLICNDLWANPECSLEPDPHLTQELAKQGAQIIFHAVNGGRSSDPYMDVVHQYHESNLRMRAKAGKIWIVTVDNCFPLNVACAAPCGVIKPDGNWAVKTQMIGEQYFSYSIEI
jgi:predicted amidohydrolase